MINPQGRIPQSHFRRKSNFLDKGSESLFCWNRKQNYVCFINITSRQKLPYLNLQYHTFMKFVTFLKSEMFFGISSILLICQFISSAGYLNIMVVSELFCRFQTDVSIVCVSHPVNCIDRILTQKYCLCAVQCLLFIQSYSGNTL